MRILTRFLNWLRRDGTGVQTIAGGRASISLSLGALGALGERAGVRAGVILTLPRFTLSSGAAISEAKAAFQQINGTDCALQNAID